MIRVLEPLEAQVLHPPTYDNTHLANFASWYRDNEPRIAAWFEELRRSANGYATDFFEFAACQHDLAIARSRR